MPFIFNFLHWFSALTLITLSFLCLKKANSRTGYHLCVFFLLVSAWCLTAALTFMMPDLQTKIEITRLKFVFVPFIPVTIFLMARCFANHEKISKTFLAAIFFIPAVTALISVGPYHYLITDNYKIETIFGSPVLTFTNGIWFSIHIIYSRIIFIWALILLVKTGVNNHLVRKASWILFFSILIPFMTDSIAVFLFPIMRYIQIVPIIMTLSAGFFYYVIFKEKILEIVPIARNMVIDYIPDIYLVIDFHHQLVDFNIHAKKMLNLDKHSFGKMIKSINPDAKGIIDHLNIMLWSEQSTGEYEVRGLVPREFYSFRLENVQNGNSAVIGKVIVIKNISEQKKFEVQLTQTVEMRTKFIGIMAHDLINNVSGHTLFLESLLDHHLIDKDPDLKASVDFLLHSSHNVTKFVEGLLTWSKENLDTMQMKKTKADINHLVSDSINFLEAFSIQKDIEFDINITPGLLADVDPDMILTVFRNIIANAIKLSPMNSTIAISAEVNAGEMEITIEDEGPGVNEEELNKFLKGMSLGSYKGGLGLTLCRDFIHMHNGQIRVKNKLPQGALFTFTLPAI